MKRQPGSTEYDTKRIKASIVYNVIVLISLTRFCRTSSSETQGQLVGASEKNRQRKVGEGDAPINCPWVSEDGRT